MSLDLIKFAFVAGELSPTFLGRSDLEKFDLGLAEAVNWFVDYRGGLTTRPGTVFCDYIKDDDKETRMFPFKYAPDGYNTYALLFGDNYIRFIQNGAYILETAKTITAITKADPGVVTSNAHGFENGDWVKLSIVGMSELHSRTVVVANKATNTFELTDPFGNDIDTTLYNTFTSGTASRIYTLVSPYGEEDLAGLHAFQYRDLVRLTHLDYAPRELIRSGATSWSISSTSIGNGVTRPSGLASEPREAGTSGVGFRVTAVDQDDNESLASNLHVEEATTDYSVEVGGVLLTWNSVTNAQYYNVYRTLIASLTTQFSTAAQVGYVGRAHGPEFQDPNIIPDFTKTPPRGYNPFANGRIEAVNVISPGSGYDQFASTVSVSGGGGSGFIGQAIVNADGQVIAVLVINGGSGYSASPSVSFGGGGTGAVGSATVSAQSGNYPSLSCVFQQRQIYAATTNAPLTIFGSKPKQFDNFDYSDIVLANDSYEFDIDSEEVTPIKHMKSVRGGLLVMTDGGVWQLTGGGVGDAVTPTNALADPQTYTGISDVPPIAIDTDLIYIESKGFTVRMLAYNDFSRIYAGNDISILSNHLFSTSNYITQWSFASDPHKLVWARRLDGAMLMFTLVKEQNVYAWTRAYTKGLFQDVLAIQEGNSDVVYTVVKRLVNGRWTKFIEYFAPRTATAVEDAHCLDCGLQLGATYPAATLTASSITGAVTFTASAAVFSSGDVGKVLRMGGGKATITTYTDTTHVDGTWTRDLTMVIPEDPDETPLPALEGEWTLDAPAATVGGLWHLEGETVSILADGNVMPTQVVTNGTISVGAEATRVIVGLPFTCVAKTLPLSLANAVIENRRKRVTGIGVRLNESRGLKAGTRRNKLYAMRERTTESYGEPTNLLSEMKNVLVMPHWDNDGQLYLVQEQPLPASILGFVATAEVGDDPE